jgi:hypothetical protein
MAPTTVGKGHSSDSAASRSGHQVLNFVRAAQTPTPAVIHHSMYMVHPNWGISREKKIEKSCTHYPSNSARQQEASSLSSEVSWYLELVLLSPMRCHDGDATTGKLQKKQVEQAVHARYSRAGMV